MKRTTLLHEIFEARNFGDILISRYFSGKIEFRGFGKKCIFQAFKSCVYSVNVKLESTDIEETQIRTRF